MNEKPYAIDIEWFEKIHCRHPSNTCINFIEFLILNDEDEIIDSIRLYPQETNNKRIYWVDRERYLKIKKYTNKEVLS